MCLLAPILDRAVRHINSMLNKAFFLLESHPLVTFCMYQDEEFPL